MTVTALASSKNPPTHQTLLKHQQPVLTQFSQASSFRSPLAQTDHLQTPLLKTGGGLLAGTLSASIGSGAAGYLTGRVLNSELTALLLLQGGLTKIGPLSGLAGGITAGLTTRDPGKGAWVGALAGTALATALFKPSSTWGGALIGGAALGGVAGAISGYLTNKIR